MSQREELREEFEDRLFDHGLVEVAGNRRPPDLTARVLKAVHARSRYGSSATFAVRASLLAASILGLVAFSRFHRTREADKQVAVVDAPRADVTAERQPAPASTEDQLAALVDEFNSLMKQNRFEEAEKVYERAATLAPNELVVQQLKNTVKMVARTQRNAALRERRENGQFALQSVEQSTTPVEEERPYQFRPNNNRWIDPLSHNQYFSGVTYSGDINAVREMRHRGIIDQMYQVDLSRIPAPDEPPIIYPDPEIWQMLAERRKKYKAVDLSREDATNIAALAALDEKTERDFTDQSLQDVLDYFKAKHGLEIQIDKKALEESGVGIDLPITRKLKGISLRAALRVLLNERDLTYLVRNGVVLITSKHAADDLIAKDADADLAAGDRYSRIIENPFLAALDNPLSTFSIDVDTASYAKVRRYLLDEGKLPPPDAVRIEELVNYFDYDYAPPEGDAPFTAHVEVTACPWQLKHRLVRIGLKGREIPAEARPAANLVFLLDVSGSMEPDDKLPRVRRAMRMLVEQLRENDRVAIVVYAAQSGLVLPSTTGFEKDRILAALDSLQAGGGTNGGDGIRLAYDIAQKSFQKDGVNRVILCTDGDFNVGTTNNAELERLIEERAKNGVFLTVLGFGMGNHNDELMEKLADKGNGNYGYIDSEAEARKLLVEQAGGTLVTIAKDVKLQLEFNPRLVGAYRLIGYEDRLLAAEDFNNDRKDAGEIGAGHTVTALYELIPAGEPVNVPRLDGLKYQRPAALTEAAGANELLTLKLKYKRPDGNKSLAPIISTVRDDGRPLGGASADTQFAAAVAGFGLLLRDSLYKGDLTYDAVIEIATQAVGADPRGHRAEFLQLVRKARDLAP